MEFNSEKTDTCIHVDVPPTETLADGDYIKEFELQDGYVSDVSTMDDDLASEGSDIFVEECTSDIEEIKDNIVEESDDDIAGESDIHIEASGILREGELHCIA